jgi:hypothetical protein
VLKQGENDLLVLGTNRVNEGNRGAFEAEMKEVKTLIERSSRG